MPIPIFMSCNDNYAVHLCVVIASAVRNSKSKFHFVILNRGLSDESVANIKSCAGGNTVDFVLVDSAMFESFNVKLEHLSMEACFRYLIPQLPYDFKKCVYLDCDVVVLDDLQELYDIDIDGFYAAGSCDVMKKSYLARIGVKRYLNSGVMLLNLEKMRADMIPQKLFDESRVLSGEAKFLDQDVLNIVLSGKTKMLNSKWNAVSSFFRKRINLEDIPQSELANAITNPSIVHFTGPDKPWVIPCGITAHPFTPAYYYYLSLTPYAHKARAMRESFKSFARFFWYLRRHLLFPLRPQFFKMRLLYIKNKKTFVAHC